MKKALKVSTFAVPLSGNKGSASMLTGLRDAFEASNTPVSIAVFSYYPNRDAQLAAAEPDMTVHPGHPKNLAFQLIPSILLYKISPGLVPASLKLHVESLAESDVVLLVGGTTFADSMLFKMPWNILATLPAYLLKKKTLFLSQTLGPFNKPINRIGAKETLKRAFAVHGRGRASAEHVRKLGISQSEYRPDLSFTMKVPGIADACAKHPVLADLMSSIHGSNKRPVGIAPNSIVYNKAKKVGRDYIDFMANVLNTVNGARFQPVLIPHSYIKDAKTYHNNDRGLCLEILKRSGLTSIPFLDADLPADVLRALIGQMYILVASRFHAMVSALAMGVPPITFGWGDQKYTEVLSEFGAADMYRSYSELDALTFKRLFDNTLANRDEIASRINAARPDVLKEAEAIPAIILNACYQKK